MSSCYCENFPRIIVVQSHYIPQVLYIKVHFYEDMTFSTDLSYKRCKHEHPPLFFVLKLFLSEKILNFLLLLTITTLQIMKKRNNLWFQLFQFDMQDSQKALKRTREKLGIVKYGHRPKKSQKIFKMFLNRLK